MLSSQSGAVGLGIDTRDSYYDHGQTTSGSDHPGHHMRALERRARLPKRTLTGPRAPRRPPQRPPPPLGTHVQGSNQPTQPLATPNSSQIRPSDGRGILSTAKSLIPIAQPELSRSHIQKGLHDALDPALPRGSGTAPRQHRRASISGYPDTSDRGHGSALPRDVTLLSFGGSHTRSAVELKALLGDSHARLKPGAVILPEHVRHSADKKARKEYAVAYEQAKSRARVEVDIVLESNVCVQGGYLRGHIKVRIRKRPKKEGPVLLSEGKLRVVGYEVAASEDAHHTFYHCGAPLSSVTDASSNIYSLAPNNEGFAPGVEGLHIMPFAFKLPADDSFGNPKGVLTLAGGTLVRYIAMVYVSTHSRFPHSRITMASHRSIKVKDAETGKRSIAHFYRQCEVWPYLNPNTVLQSASRPLQASTAKSLAVLGNSSKVRLNAQMHRLYWPAGSRCPIHLHVGNESKKTIKNLVLTLVRTITVFRPRPALDAGGDRDPDACQTATAHKAVSESALEMCAGVAKGHASAKGWWTGVPPGRQFDFIHYIQLPVSFSSSTCRGHTNPP